MKKKVVCLLIAAMVAVIAPMAAFGQAAVTPHRIGTAVPTTKPLWSGGDGAKPPEGRFACSAGLIPVVQGTAQSIHGGNEAQLLLDGERARLIQPPNWDGGWASTGTTTVMGSTAVWCVEPREVKILAPDPCMDVRLDPQYSAATTGTVDGDVNGDGVYDAADCREAVVRIVNDAMPEAESSSVIAAGPCDFILGQYPAVDGRPAGDVDGDGDYDAADCDEHVRNMVNDALPAAAPTPPPFLEMIRVGLQFGWNVGSVRQTEPDNGPVGSLYMGLDINQFWLEGAFGVGADVRPVGQAYPRPVNIRGSFVAGFMTPGEQHRVRFGFGVGSRSTGPHLVEIQKADGGTGSEVLGDASNRVVGVFKVAYQPVKEAPKWHLQIFVELAAGNLEYPVPDGLTGASSVRSSFGGWAQLGLRVGFM